MRLPLDGTPSHAVTGAPGHSPIPPCVRRRDRAVHWLATQRVKANLFYRGLTFHHFPVIGDTLYTRTEVVGPGAEFGQTRRARPDWRRCG